MPLERLSEAHRRATGFSESPRVLKGKERVSESARVVDKHDVNSGRFQLEKEATRWGDIEEAASKNRGYFLGSRWAYGIFL